MRTKSSDDKEKTAHIDGPIGNRLRDFREAMGWTQGECGAAIGLSRGAWEHFEGGGRISASQLWQFCNVCGIRVEQVFQGLPFTIGPTSASDPAEVDGARGVAEESAAFIAPDERDAIITAIEALPRFQRPMALAAVRGMGQRGFKTP